MRQEPGNLGLRFFKDYDRSYTPLTYPLLFPHGTDGWTLNIRSLTATAKSDDVTILEWLRFHLMKRPNHYNFFHSANKLFQQYIVDEFERNQCADLAWMYANQKTLRADLYKAVQDSIHSNDVASSGRATILPSSYTCSDRWYQSKYKDAMAIVRTKGKPTFFITMTMNPKCPEVMEHLKPGQSPYDRPDLLCRIFDLKKKHFSSASQCRSALAFATEGWP